MGAATPNKFLHGNGVPCADCAGTGRKHHGHPIDKDLPCAMCRGTGRAARLPEQIIEDMLRKESA